MNLRKLLVLLDALGRNGEHAQVKMFASQKMRMNLQKLPVLLAATGRSGKRSESHNVRVSKDVYELARTARAARRARAERETFPSPNVRFSKVVY